MIVAGCVLTRIDRPMTEASPLKRFFQYEWPSTTTGSDQVLLSFPGSKQAPERGVDPEHREVVSGYVGHGDALGTVVGAEPGETDVVGCGFAEQVPMLRHVDVVLPREVVRVLVLLMRRREDVEVLWIGDRERSNQERVDDAEDRGVGANAEAQSERDGDSEARVLDQHPKPQANVLPKSLKHHINRF